MTPEEVAGDGEPEEQAARRRGRRDALARDIYQAGHHTTFQHAHFQFALANVSRQFLWSFLHSHPFYNSEQVSQRYVHGADGQLTRCRRSPARRSRSTAPPPSACRPTMPSARRAADAGRARRLLPSASRPGATSPSAGRRRSARRRRRSRATCCRWRPSPTSTTRSRRSRSSATGASSSSSDAPLEQRLVVDGMVEAVLAADPDFARVLEEPMPLEATVEHAGLLGARPRRAGARVPRALRRRASTAGSARLVDWPAGGRGDRGRRGARSARRRRRRDSPTTRRSLLVLDPARNRYLGEALNLATHSKLARCLVHVHYTFRKRLSHTADSQDQRHRMTPASRPILAAQVDGEPDVVAPALIARDEESRPFYHGELRARLGGHGRLARLGVPTEHAHYLLPNAVADPLHRVGRPAQPPPQAHDAPLPQRPGGDLAREPGRGRRDPRASTPAIGRWLLPPCSQRDRAGARPPCPEGAATAACRSGRLELADVARDI